MDPRGCLKVIAPVVHLGVVRSHGAQIQVLLDLDRETGIIGLQNVESVAGERDAELESWVDLTVVVYLVSRGFPSGERRTTRSASARWNHTCRRPWWYKLSL